MMIHFLLTLQFVSGDSGGCNKNPVLYISTPEKLKALSGSCLHIPCNFSVIRNVTVDKISTEIFRGENFGVWMKHDSRFKVLPENVIFNSSGTRTTYPLKITGNLEKQNCTTLFDNLTTQHTDTYFFRIENRQFQATASCSGFQLTVRDSPWNPSINIPVGDLKEHQSVTITCSALTPCPHSPPELTWNLQQDSHRQTEKNTDGTFTTKIQETITLSDTHDGYNISCSARYPVKGGSKTAATEVTLSVSYAPKDTSASISPSGLVSAGSWVELSCSSRAKPPPSFTWFRNNKHGAINVSVGQVYRINMTNMKDMENHYCVAANILGSKTSTWSHQKNQGMKASILSGAFAGGLIGIIIVVCGVFILWRWKSKHSALHQPQNSGEPANTLENQDIHYGEIDFSVMTKPVKKAQDETDLQGAMYSQVKVGRTEHRPKETLDCIYVQVKKKSVNLNSTQ